MEQPEKKPGYSTLTISGKSSIGKINNRKRSRGNVSILKDSSPPFFQEYGQNDLLHVLGA
jgi:hypothetical protein